METITVTYMGPNGALLHSGPSGENYMFYLRKPKVITDERDIAFYRRKEASGSPFKVHPKLEYKTEPIMKAPIKSNAILLTPNVPKVKSMKPKEAKYGINRNRKS